MTLNSLRLPFAIVAFLLSVALAVMAYLDISQPFFTPISKVLATINPVLTGFLGIWVTRDAQRKQQLADDYLYDLTQLSSLQVHLYFLIRRVVDETKAFVVPDYFARETEFHQQLRRLRRARLLSGVDGSQFRVGRKYVVARWTERLTRISITTSDGKLWHDISDDISRLAIEEVHQQLRKIADATPNAEQSGERESPVARVLKS